MKTNRISRINPNAKRIAKLDDYDLPSEFPLDPREMKPNPYAGRVQFSRGGTRAGAGRKRAPEPLERHTITFYKSHADYLRRVDANLSRAIRKLLEAKAK
jgi:hypothetical protein